MIYRTSPTEERPFFPLSITSGSDSLRGYQKSHPPSAGVNSVTRHFCSTCGTHLFNAPEGAPIISVFPYVWDKEPSSSPAVTFQPSYHSNFRHHTLDLKDDQPKFMDFPPRE